MPPLRLSSFLHCRLGLQIERPLVWHSCARHSTWGSCPLNTIRSYSLWGVYGRRTCLHKITVFLTMPRLALCDTFSSPSLACIFLPLIIFVQNGREISLRHLTASVFSFPKTRLGALLLPDRSFQLIGSAPRNLPRFCFPSPPPLGSALSIFHYRRVP